jgi:hypothetical protein
MMLLPVLLLLLLLPPQERREEGRGRPGGRPSRLRSASQHAVCASSPIASCSDCAVARIACAAVAVCTGACPARARPLTLLSPDTPIP